MTTNFFSQNYGNNVVSFSRIIGMKGRYHNIFYSTEATYNFLKTFQFKGFCILEKKPIMWISGGRLDLSTAYLLTNLAQFLSLAENGSHYLVLQAGRLSIFLRTFWRLRLKLKKILIHWDYENISQFLILL